jgi:hypothetical protein
LTTTQFAERTALRNADLSAIEEQTRNITFNAMHAIATGLDTRFYALYAEAELEAFNAAGEHVAFGNGKVATFLELMSSHAKELAAQQQRRNAPWLNGG